MFPRMKPTTIPSLKELLPDYTSPKYIRTRAQVDELYTKCEEILPNTLKRLLAEKQKQNQK